jgi:pimeloyl-ACP methyl ester carboxylesterase
VGISRAHFVGHSFGAKVCLYAAATYQDLVDKLVIMGSPGVRTPPSLSVRAKSAMSKGARLTGLLGPPGRLVRQAVYRRIASSDYREAGAMRPVLVKVVNEDLSGLLGRVTAPTLLVWGTEDDAVPVAQAKRMDRLLSDSGLVLLEGAGHFAYLDQPGRLCRILHHFLGPGAGAGKEGAKPNPGPSVGAS